MSAIRVIVRETDPKDLRRHRTLEDARQHKRPGVVSLVNLAARNIGRSQTAIVRHCGVVVTVTRKPAIR